MVASASTHARLALQPDDSTDGFTNIAFDIYGMNTTAVPITASVKFGTGNNSAYPDLSDLRDKINGFSGDTGINAKLSADGSYLDLTSPDGYDITIDNFDLPLQNDTAYNTRKEAAVTTNGSTGIPAATPAVVNITGHGFVDGDIVVVDLEATETQTWLRAGQQYVVTSAAADTFQLGTYDANGTITKVNASGGNAGKIGFTKVEKGLTVQTLDRDENPKGTSVLLVDKEIANSEVPIGINSTRLTGQVVFESPNVFTVTPKTTQGSLFRDDPDSASLRKISDMDVLTVRNAQRMMSAVDGALRKVDAERGDLGATMNRMEHTIDNLSNIVVNTTVSRGRIEDADMAEESVNLSKSQVLQQAATAMLAQANQSMQSVLDLLR